MSCPYITHIIGHLRVAGVAQLVCDYVHEPRPVFGYSTKVAYVADTNAFVYGNVADMFIFGTGVRRDRYAFVEIRPGQTDSFIITLGSGPNTVTACGVFTKRERCVYEPDADYLEHAAATCPASFRANMLFAPCYRDCLMQTLGFWRLRHCTYTPSEFDKVCDRVHEDWARWRGRCT